mmetsp:Transcript_2777/g.6690  ORF Transcript_2777/g.6690 Transcript_2777/m.6690 type:complete len:244 (+) Transcript_2777:2189-2920(+)
MAWPKVWPRLSVALTPPSRSSSATMAALMAQLRSTAKATAAGSPSMMSSTLRASSSHRKSSASRISPYLTTSLTPDAVSRGGRDASAAGSVMTHAGWWNAPIMFLPRGWFTPVFPPTELSTIAITVVGAWMKPTPRWKDAAAYPVMSPITPPPNATKVDLRLNLHSSALSKIFSRTCIVLYCSPSGRMTCSTCTVSSASLMALRMPSRYMGAMVSFVTMSTCFPPFRWRTTRSPACPNKPVPM